MKKAKLKFPMHGDLASFLLGKLAEQGASIPHGFKAPPIVTRWDYRDEGVGFVIVVAENHARAVIKLARRIFGDPHPPDAEYVGQTYFTRKSDGIVVRINETGRSMDILCLGLNRNRAKVMDCLRRGVRAAMLEAATEDFDRPIPPGSEQL